MDKYKRLASNTLIVAIGTFGSRVLVFLLMPFYTRMLSTGEYGTVDVIVQACNLLMPLAAVGISNAVVRFGLEENSDKNAVFTAGLLINLIGFAALCLTIPFWKYIEMLRPYTALIFAYILSASLFSLCSQFIRSLGQMKRYAMIGIVHTAVTIISNILLLAVFRMGINGYVISCIVADWFAVVLLFLIARLPQYLSLKSVHAPLVGEMLRYSIPLIPTTMCSWIINMSDRYLITYFIGADINGIYSVANKIPTVMIIIANMFSDAWQISAVGEETADREQFFSKILRVYCTLSFCCAAGLIWLTQPLIRLLSSADYFSAWQYMPILILATLFCCLSSYLASIYMVEKRSVSTFVTILIGAIANIVLNLIFIPMYGAFGAAGATLVSYCLMFVARALHTRLFLPLVWDKKRFFLNLVLVIAMTVVLLSQMPYWPVVLTALFALVMGWNYRGLLEILQTFLHKKRPSE